HRQRHPRAAVDVQRRGEPALDERMSMRRLAGLLTAGIVLLTGTAVVVAVAMPSARADNPIVQTVYTADPAPMVHNGRVHLYTGHDEDNSTYFAMKEWRVYSSDDMVNWTDHGSPMRLGTFSWASANAWARQGAHRNGKL